MPDTQTPPDVMSNDSNTMLDQPIREVAPPASTSPAPASSASGPSASATPAFGSGVMTFLSTLNVATLLSLLVGVCIFYDHSWREAYFGSFGLDPNVVPTSVQDSIVSGFLGLNQHVLWLLVILTVLIAGYVAAMWLGTNWLARIAPKLGINDRGTPPETLVALGRSGGFRASLLASAGALALTVTSGSALLLVGLPADKAGRHDAAHLRAHVKSSQSLCVRYRLKDQAEIVGRSVGSSATDQYVLGTDDALHVVKLSDLTALFQMPVPCGRAQTSK